MESFSAEKQTTFSNSIAAVFTLEEFACSIVVHPAPAGVKGIIVNATVLVDVIGPDFVTDNAGVRAMQAKAEHADFVFQLGATLRLYQKMMSDEDAIDDKALTLDPTKVEIFTTNYPEVRIDVVDEIVSATMHNPGSGYATGDLFSIAAGSEDPDHVAQLAVTGVTPEGAITSLVVVAGGMFDLETAEHLFNDVTPTTTISRGGDGQATLDLSFMDIGDRPASALDDGDDDEQGGLLCGDTCAHIISSEVPCTDTWAMGCPTQDAPAGFTASSSLFEICPSQCEAAAAAHEAKVALPADDDLEDLANDAEMGHSGKVVTVPVVFTIATIETFNQEKQDTFMESIAAVLHVPRKTVVLDVSMVDTGSAGSGSGAGGAALAVGTKMIMMDGPQNSNSVDDLAERVNAVLDRIAA